MATPPASYPGILTAIETVVNVDLSAGWTGLEAGVFNADTLPMGLSIGTDGIVTGTTFSIDQLTTTTVFYQPTVGDVVLGPAFDWRVGDGAVFEAYPAATDIVAGGFTARATVIEALADTGPYGNDLVMTLDLTSSLTFTLVCHAGYTYDGTVDWGDGSQPETVSSNTDLTHVYPDAGPYQMRVSGQLGGLGVNTGNVQVTSIDNLGNLQYVQWDQAFRGMPNLATVFNSSTLVTGTLTNITNCFRGLTALNTFDGRGFDVSNVSLNYALFRDCTSATEINLAGWDVRSITDFGYMFANTPFGVAIGLDTWQIPPQANYFNLFREGTAGLTTAEYDKVLVAWEQQLTTPVPNTDISFGTSKYTAGGAAEAARTAINGRGWDVKDGGASTPSVDYGDVNVYELIVADGETVTMNSQSGGTHTGTVNWGDDTGDMSISAWNDPNYTHTYTDAGTYIFRSWGTFGARQILAGTSRDAPTKLLNIGNNNWGNLYYGFSHAPNLTSIGGNTTSTTVQGTITDLRFAFSVCTALETVDLAGFDTSGVTDFSGLFNSDTALTSVDVSTLNTASAITLDNMFDGGVPFGVVTGMANWDVTNVTSMVNTFSSPGGLTTEEYDAVLIAWAAYIPFSYNFTMYWGDSKYTPGGAAATARQQFVDAGHPVNDGGPAS